MKKAEFKKLLTVWGDCFYNETCPALQYEIIKKVINCKTIDECSKTAIIEQYVSCRATNSCVVECMG